MLRAMSSTDPTAEGGYRYDLFVSYPNRGRIPEWVRDVLVPLVTQVLDEHLDAPPRIAFDRSIFKAGDRWPDALADMHATSRAFLLVLAYPYFNQGWCVSEWLNALERARLSATAGKIPPIVVPIRYNDLSDRDLERLPEAWQTDIRRHQLIDFERFTPLVNHKTDSNDGHSFRKSVETLCRDSLRRAIEAAPPWRADWPRLPREPWSGSDPRWKSRL